MCVICKKIDFLVETMEKFQTLDDWKVLLLSVGMDTEAEQIVMIDDLNVWCNIIGLITAHWYYRKGVPMPIAMNTLFLHMQHEYYVKDQTFHHGEDELKEYDS